MSAPKMVIPFIEWVKIGLPLALGYLLGYALGKGDKENDTEHSEN